MATLQTPTDLEERVRNLESLFQPSDFGIDDAARIVEAGGQLTIAQKLSLIWDFATARRQLDKLLVERDRERHLRAGGLAQMPEYLLTSDEAKARREQNERDKLQALRDAETAAYNRDVKKNDTSPIIVRDETTYSNKLVTR